MNNTDKYGFILESTIYDPQSDIKCQTTITVISITTETTTSRDFSIEIHKIEILSSHRNMLPVKLTSIYMDGEGSYTPSSIVVCNEILHSGSHPKALF